jgi:hypothetical protein
MGIGKFYSQLKMLSSYIDAGWDFDDIWELPEDSYPQLLNPRSGYSGDSVRLLILSSSALSLTGRH